MTILVFNPLKGYLEPNTILKEGIFKPSFLSELCFSAHAYAFSF